MPLFSHFYHFSSKALRYIILSLTPDISCKENLRFQIKNSPHTREREKKCFWGFKTLVRFFTETKEKHGILCLDEQGEMNFKDLTRIKKLIAILFKNESLCLCFLYAIEKYLLTFHCRISLTLLKLLNYSRWNNNKTIPPYNVCGARIREKMLLI